MTAPAHTYRPDIDGLRAVAVIAVILFHLEVPGFAGGFVGVDVFFVISGYLITAFIRREIEAEGFRYSQFFVRRVRRLAPALMLLTVACCIAAVPILLPEQLDSFARSVIAQPIALQNMHFVAEGQYFVGSDGKPLLHTWSLGVEEQFYLVWPFILMWLSRTRRRLVLGLLVVIVGSFALNLLLPILSPKASFFLFPARAWELGLGGLLAVLEERGSAWRPRTRRTVSWASFVALAFSLAWIDEEMAFPGWVAILPVTATVGLIASASPSDALTRGFSHRPVVRVGLVSYALYLWHWPIIVFAGHLGFDPLEPATLCAIVLLTFVCAEGSYRLVEQPVRRRRVLSSNRALLSTMLAVGIAVIAFAMLVIRTDGLSFRYEEPARSMLTAPFDAEGDERCGIVFRSMHPAAVACPVREGGERPVLLWGNSHAAMWVGLFEELGYATDRSVYLTTRNCRPTPDNAFCNERIQSRVLDFIRDQNIEAVVFANTWYGAYDIEDDVFEAELGRIVETVAELDVELWLVVDVPGGEALDPIARYRESPGSPSFGEVPRGERPVRERRLLERLAEGRANVHVIDPTDDYCDAERCPGGDEDSAWYRDDEHLTAEGVRRARERFAPVFD